MGYVGCAIVKLRYKKGTLISLFLELFSSVSFKEFLNQRYIFRSPFQKEYKSNSWKTDVPSSHGGLGVIGIFALSRGNAEISTYVIFSLKKNSHRTLDVCP